MVITILLKTFGGIHFSLYFIGNVEASVSMSIAKKTSTRQYQSQLSVLIKLHKAEPREESLGWGHLIRVPLSNFPRDRTFPVNR